MSIEKIIISLFCFVSINVLAQNIPIKKQLTGAVLDVKTNKGIEGVQVRLVSTGDIKYTDSEGKFKFFNEKGFVVGEPNYSFIIYKEGYLVVGSTNSKVMYGSGDIGNLGMKLDINRYLWITVIDGISGSFLSNVEIEIKGKTQVTNSQGRAKFDLSNYGNQKVTAIFSKNCYKDEILEAPTKGEKIIRLISTCNLEEKKNDMTPYVASQILERALKYRNGARQGQIEAIEFLRDNEYDFNSENFQGLNLKGLKLTHTNLKSTNFDYTNISDADFTESKFNDSRFHFATAKNINFYKSNLAKSKGVFLQAPNGNFGNSDLSLTYFIGCDFSHADFSGANLDGALFAFCNFTGAKFNNAQITNTGIFGSVLDNTEFQGAIIHNTDINGSVSLNGVFPLSRTQEKGLCQYVDSNRLLYVFGAGKSFEFKLMEDTHGSYRRYDDVVTENYLFRNFGNSTCNICDTKKWSANKWRDYYSYFKVLKDQDFLRKNNRIQFTKDIVTSHLNFLLTKLILKNTYKNQANFTFWNNDIKKYFNNSKTKKTSINATDIETLTALIIKFKPKWESKVPWRLLASSKIHNYLKNEVDSLTHRGRSRYIEILPEKLNILPPSVNENTIPRDWVEYYKTWMKKKSKNQPKPLYLTVKNGKNYTPSSWTFTKNKGTLKIGKGGVSRNRSKDINEEDLYNAFREKGVNPNFIGTPRIENDHYYHYYGNYADKVKKNIFINFLYPDDRVSYGFKISTEIDKKNTDGRLELELEGIKSVKYKNDEYIFFKVRPKTLELKNNNSNNWFSAFNFDLAKKPKYLTATKNMDKRALFNIDIVAITLLNKNLAKLENFDLSGLVGKHRRQLKKYNYLGEPFPYQYVFANYLMSKPKDYDYTPEYKEWLIKNSKLGIETFCIPIRAKTLENNTIKIEFWKKNYNYPHMFIYQYLKENDIKNQRAVKLDETLVLSYTTKSNLIIGGAYVIYPQDKRMAEIKPIDNVKIEDLICYLEVKIEKVKYVDKGQKSLIYHVVPKTLFYKLRNTDATWKTIDDFKP